MVGPEECAILIFCPVAKAPLGERPSCYISEERDVCVHGAGGGGGVARTDRSFQSLPQLFSPPFTLAF